MAEIEIKAATEAVEKLNRAFEEFKSTNDANLQSRDTVLDAKLAKIEADMDAAQKVADEAVLAAKRASRLVTEDSTGVDLDAKALHWARGVARSRGIDVREFGNAEMIAYKQAFQAYMRKGEQIMGAQEAKALSVGSDPDGGFVVNPDMSGRIVNRVFETSPMRAYASVQVISTDALEGLFDLNEVESGWVGETESRPETGTPAIGKWRIAVHEQQAKPSATQKLLDDAEIDMESWLASKVADKFARDEAVAFVTGNGVAKPRGFLSYAGGTTLPGTIERIKTGANGAFVAAPNGGDALIDAVYSLKSPYRVNANWFMNRATATLVRRLKDNDGQYLWQNGITLGQPMTLLGYPVAPFEDMPAPATGSLSIAFGDMRAAYQIVDRAGIRTLRDPYSNKPHVQFYTTRRVGGDVVNFEAIKLLEFATL